MFPREDVEEAVDEAFPDVSRSDRTIIVDNIERYCTTPDAALPPSDRPSSAKYLPILALACPDHAVILAE